MLCQNRKAKEEPYQIEQNSPLSFFMPMTKDVAKKGKAIDEKIFECDDARQPCEGNVHGMSMEQRDSNQRQGKEDEFEPDPEEGRRSMGFSCKGIRGQKDNPCEEKKTGMEIAGTSKEIPQK
jgi:hypothetical protein